MNANELSKDRADILADELLAYHNKGVCGRAAKMLRQQQAEIEALKAKYEDDYAKAFENGYAIGLSHGKDLVNNG